MPRWTRDEVRAECALLLAVDQNTPFTEEKILAQFDITNGIARSLFSQSPSELLALDVNGAVERMKSHVTDDIKSCPLEVLQNAVYGYFGKNARPKEFRGSVLQFKAHPNFLVRSLFFFRLCRCSCIRLLQADGQESFTLIHWTNSRSH